MKNPNYLSGAFSTRLSQAFDENQLGGGAWNDRVTRRRFLKRTGGATAGVLIAWNLTSLTSRGSITDLSAGSAGEKQNWKIRAAKFEMSDDSSGSEVSWSWGGINYKVRRTLILVASAPETEFGLSATSDITISVTESAEFKVDGAPEPNPWKSMDDQEGVPSGMFNAWRNGSRDEHVANASITKSINPDTGEVTTVARTAHGTTEGTPEYDNSETESNINIKIEWDGDIIKVTFGSTYVNNESTQSDVPFEVKPSVIIVQ